MSKLVSLARLWNSQLLFARQRQHLALKVNQLLLEEPVGTKVRLGNALLEHIPRSMSVTLDDPTEDGEIRKVGSNPATCVTAPPERDTLGAIISFGGARGPYETTGTRAYVEWDISSIPDNDGITKVVFKYYGRTDDARSEEINPLTEGQPSVISDTNLWNYIATGTAYVDPFNIEHGTNKQVDLGASAVSDLQDAIDAE